MLVYDDLFVNIILEQNLNRESCQLHKNNTKVYD